MDESRPPAASRVPDVAMGIAQGSVYAFLAREALGPWPVVGALLATAAVAQIVGVGLGARRRGGALAGAVSLVMVAAVLGMHLQAILHVMRAFHPIGAGMAWESLGGVLLALPWVVAVPIVQIVRGRAGRAGEAAVAALLVPVIVGLADGRAEFGYRPVDGEAVAAWVWARAGGGDDAPPQGPGPVRIVVTAFEGGSMLDRAVLEGDDLAEALGALDLRVARGPERAVVVEVALAEGPLPTLWLAPDSALARPGEDGLSGGGEVHGARASWQGDLSMVRVGPTLWVPGPVADVARGAERWTRYRAWIASDAGVTPLDRGWARAPALDAERARESALAGAAMIARGQRDDGRYAYVVHGPEGRVGTGYNFPRHAGATWFLAQAGRRDPMLVPATERGLAFLRAHTREEGEQAWVVDPDRDDGRAWVGTTALTLLAVLEAHGPTAEAGRYAAFVAASVDERGRVRGDFDMAARAFPEQPEVTYAQGQGLLALAFAKSAGLPVDSALERAAAWSDGGYRPGDALFSLDDHWGCIAALAVHEAVGRPAGVRACDAWLATVRDRPVRGAPLEPPAGPAGAVAEAWVARALLAERRGEPGPWASVAASYGQVLLAQQYRAADAPLLGHPTRLLGGFRDRPWQLDVRVDAVQHVGCALLGLERLLRGGVSPTTDP